jgi:hypothetical protein
MYGTASAAPGEPAKAVAAADPKPAVVLVAPRVVWVRAPARTRRAAMVALVVWVVPAAVAVMAPPVRRA